MRRVAILGAGKIGSLIALLLLESGAYEVSLVDLDFSGDDQKRLETYQQRLHRLACDVQDPAALRTCFKQHPQQAVISCLPYYCNQEVVKLAKENGWHYFDLTEDTSITEFVRQQAEGAACAFVPQCGLAPGFIGIAANSIMKKFEKLDIVKLRVGALPVNSSNTLRYSLTWSTDGLINEYGNLCYGVVNGSEQVLHPLKDLETIEFDGVEYEAFNTSGGLGSLAELYQGQLNQLNYKTIRYPGHRDKMQFLMMDLKLNEKRDILKSILEDAVPKTYQDVVIVYVSVTGHRDGVYLEENYVNKIYPKQIAGHHWAAIQVTTAGGACAVLDLVLNEPDRYQGFVLQEHFALDDVLANRFGKLYGA